MIQTATGNENLTRQKKWSGMASTSVSGGAAGRIRSASTMLSSDNQSLIGEIRRGFGILKEIAVDFEKETDSSKVKELETAADELLGSYEECIHFSAVLDSVTNRYQPGEELTDFKKLFEAELAKVKGNGSSSQSHTLRRQFQEAVWNVHHAGQPMPGEEQEDIVMTSTQSILLNPTCPLSGKPLLEIKEPVWGVECKHIYEKAAVLHHIKHVKPPKCPMSACPKILTVEKVVRDQLLLVEIEELRLRSKQATRTNVVEDFTELDDDEEDD